MIAALLAAGLALQAADSVPDPGAGPCALEAPPPRGPGRMTMLTRIDRKSGSTLYLDMSVPLVGLFERRLSLALSTGEFIPIPAIAIDARQDGGFNVELHISNAEREALIAGGGATLYSDGQPVLSNGEPITFPISTGKMSDMFRTQCGTALLRRWGIDPASLFEEAGPGMTQMFFPGDYPGSDGRVMFLLAVGPDGRGVSCRVALSSRSTSVDARTCSLAVKRARFSAAPNGPPLRWTVGNVRWVMSNR